MTVLLLTAGFATAEEASESVTVIFENTVLSEEDADGEIWTGSYTKEVKLQEGMKMSDAVVAAAKDQFGEDGITVDNSWGFFITACISCICQKECSWKPSFVDLWMELMPRKDDISKSSDNV